MLKETTIELLRETSIPISQIAKDCELQERWLFFFRQGQYDDPGVRKVEKIYTYLTRKPLKLVPKRK